MRFDYIDIAKGFGILMVVWAHILITGWTHQMIYAFHMPLFFLLSGLLFQKEKFGSFKAFIIRRAKRLLIPYVIYSVATWILWAVFRYLRHDEVDSYYMPLLQTFIAQGSGAYMVHNSALWFIPCLFLVEIIYFFTCKTGWVWNLILCFAGTIVSFILGGIYGKDYWFLLPLNADAALIALPFYYVGNLIGQKVGHVRLLNLVVRSRIASLLVWVLMTAVLFWSSITFGECSMGSSSYQCSALIFLLRAFLGCSWMLCAALLIASLSKNNVVHSLIVRYTKWAGVNSLDIMCLHIPIKGICMIAIAVCLKVTVDDISMDASLAAFAFVASMIIIWTIIRFIPINTLIHKLHLN